MKTKLKRLSIELKQPPMDQSFTFTLWKTHRGVSEKVGKSITISGNRKKGSMTFEQDLNEGIWEVESRPRNNQANWSKGDNVAKWTIEETE